LDEVLRVLLPDVALTFELFDVVFFAPEL